MKKASTPMMEGGDCGVFGWVGRVLGRKMEECSGVGGERRSRIGVAGALAVITTTHALSSEG